MEEDDLYGDVTDPKKIKILNEYYAYDKKIRGEFLIQANHIEDIMEEIIAKLLVEGNKEKEEVVISMLRKIPYDFKIKILENLMTKFLPDWKLKQSRMVSSLGQVKKIRNIYAHSIMDLRDKFLELNLKDTVQFEIKKDGKIEYKKFTKKELKQYYDIANALISELADLDYELYKRYKKTNDSQR